MENINRNNIKMKPGSRYPFHAPDGYFDNLPQKVLSRIEEDVNPVRNSPFLNFLKPALGLLVSFVIITGIVYVPVKLIFPSKLNSSQKSIVITDGFEFFLTRAYSDLSLIEAIESNQNIENFDELELENVLLASMSEYELIQNIK